MDVSLADDATGDVKARTKTDVCLGMCMRMRAWYVVWLRDSDLHLRSIFFITLLWHSWTAATRSQDTARAALPVCMLLDVSL